MLLKSFVIAPLIALAVLACGEAALAQEQTAPRRPKLKSLHATEPATKPVTRPHSTSSCSEFGAGFARLPGSDTCIRIGGSVSVGAGGRF
ncbi:MAG: porin [Xanthobacteraceae bacterium]|nr:porin [Xanthobacteraceae bacterium]